MTNRNATSLNFEKSIKVSEFRRFRRVFLGRGIVAFGLIIILILIFAAILAPLIAPFNPNTPDPANSLAPPDQTHILGTDQLGRDTFSRIIYGARTSLVIGISVVFIASVTGMALGLIAGYYGGWIFTVIMRFVDALMVFPMIMLALLIAATLGGGMKNVILALSVAMIPGYARLMCGQVLYVRENEYITAVNSLGASDFRIMVRHIIPNCLPSYIVLITLLFGAVILAEAGLSFLGIGITPPTPSWGGMVNEGRNYLLSNPILSFAPGLSVMLVVFAFNMVGDGLRDALDPKLRGTL